MKRFRIYAETFIEAETEEEAKEEFANNSFDFASQAKCEEILPRGVCEITGCSDKQAEGSAYCPECLSERKEALGM